MKGREDNTDDKKRQGQNKKQAHIWTDKDTHTKVSVKHQPNRKAFKNASIKPAFSIISRGLAYIAV